MNEKELEGAKKLIENKDVKKGSYSFIGNSNITYADIKILLDYIKQLEQENQQLKEHLERYEIIIFNLKEQLEKSEKARKEAIDKLKTLGKFDGEKCTRSFKLWTTDFNELISILDIDKGE